MGVLTTVGGREREVRRRLRAFANEVKAAPGYAFRLPDDLFDLILDNELEAARETLVAYGLTQRPSDGRWEKR